MGINIAVPSYGGIHPRTTEALVNLSYALGIMGVKDVTYSNYRLPDDMGDIRNAFVTSWYFLTDAAFLLQVDGDMGFEPKLVMDMMFLDKPVVGTLYKKKDATEALVGYHLPEARQEEDFVEAEKVGGGILLIRRDCIDRIIKETPAGVLRPQSLSESAIPIEGIVDTIHIFDRLPTETGTLSEDYSFCYRWKEIGGEIWANNRQPVSHYGDYEYKFPPTPG